MDYHNAEGDCITDGQTGTYGGCHEAVLHQLYLMQIPLFKIQILIVLIVAAVQFVLVVIAICTASSILTSDRDKVVWNDQIDDQDKTGLASSHNLLISASKTKCMHFNNTG